MTTNATKRFAVTVVGVRGSISCGTRYDAATARGAVELAIAADYYNTPGNAIDGNGVPAGAFTVFHDTRGNVYVVDGRTIDDLRKVLDA